MKPTFKEKQKTLFSRIKHLKENPTESELIFKSRLEKLGVKFIFQKSFIANDYYAIVDFYLPKPNKIVFEIDGEYHNDICQKYKDAHRTKYLSEIRGFRVIRIDNKDVNTFDLSFLTL